MKFIKDFFKTKYSIFLEDGVFFVARKRYWHDDYWWYVGLSRSYEETVRIIEEAKRGNWPPKPRRILVSEHE